MQRKSKDSFYILHLFSPRNSCLHLTRITRTFMKINLLLYHEAQPSVDQDLCDKIVVERPKQQGSESLYCHSWVQSRAPSSNDESYNAKPYNNRRTAEVIQNTQGSRVVNQSSHMLLLQRSYVFVLCPVRQARDTGRGSQRKA